MKTFRPEQQQTTLRGDTVSKYVHSVRTHTCVIAILSGTEDFVFASFQTTSEKMCVSIARKDLYN